MASSSDNFEEWDLARVQELVDNGVNESVRLDFKDSRKIGKQTQQLESICKTVSSFANSDGGTVIFGVTERDNQRMEIDEGIDHTEFSEEWLTDVLRWSIQPKVDSNITRIWLGEPNESRVLFVVEVKKSVSGIVHQSKDKIFYKRNGSSTLKMEYYEILDVMHRSDGPELRCGVKMLSTSRGGFKLLFEVENLSDEPALDYVLRLL